MKVLLATVIASLALAGAAQASNAPNVVFDAAATSLAGKPVAVWCEASWVEWTSVVSEYANGFTFLNQPMIFVSPRQCETLWGMVNRQNIGTYYASSALYTIAHEAMHQRGIVNEGEADCLALPLVAQLAVSHFGVPSTVSETYSVTTSTFVRVSKTKRVRVSNTRLATRSVPNPWLDELMVDALAWHKIKPAEYQGNC